ncbi:MULTISPECIES: DUF3732 domain-containing protein [Xanthomonas]|uniref:DUF3732 domain-containing protein n=1 Tax=Xanthomonas TaxID=338 RepID=UPI00096C7755|nr:DUF3732 domain-containing protein [Xanthomonas campestris]MCC5092527.1 DUF3732 domain-containing protein [Xanthomonas campestris pv. incanae]MEA9610180.1 DUF3732 domain-containing protein [Xanthomonas campestris pv. incanae]RFF48167.1 DUF3732 domain-containing protein [Xanthomonas campestris pv. incanae]WDJ08382.1 DUF3732 domain-containing protein [Xanthomonas campestris pv. incanae]
MKRWNILDIFFLGVDGQRRIVSLVPDQVNIITGASGTGKSALIKAIDYCLGSSKCELPAHVRRRTLAVGVRWTHGDDQMIVGRIVPPVGQQTSGKMFVSKGQDLRIPVGIDRFEGGTTVSAAKAFLERAFGIGDTEGAAIDPAQKGRASVRQVTPYLFLTKEVIDSETVLLHGLEKVEKAKDIIATLPYFLRATDEESILAERRLRQLQRGLEIAEAKAQAKFSSESLTMNRALGLLTEARQVGLSRATATLSEEFEVLGALRAVLDGRMVEGEEPSGDELSDLHASRRQVLAQLEVVKKKSRATKSAIRESSGYQGAVKQQHEKLMLVDHLKLGDVSHTCPVCESPSDRGREVAAALRAALSKVRTESMVVERVRPQLLEVDSELERDAQRLNVELRRIDSRIEGWLSQSERARQLSSFAQVQSHLKGRISYFIENIVDESPKVGVDLEGIRAEIEELEARVNREAKNIRLQRAERKVSEFASVAFQQLPTVAPCVGAELEFLSRGPDVVMVEEESNAVLRMPDLGSDQNYLAIHIALCFALHRYFELVNSPVPGLLVLDQVSRPYFPAKGDDYDVSEMGGGAEDEDTQAMRQHIDFLFRETQRRSGLQVLLIEHAYFADDVRYREATRERWTRQSGEALIPLDWPVREDT